MVDKKIAEHLHERGEYVRGMNNGAGPPKIWKRKGDVHDLGKYINITLLIHMLKFLERILDG